VSQLGVFSEIDQLETVVIHRPGPEVDHMTPDLMHDLLFDDILFGNEAREEHDTFCDILRKVAPNVLDATTLFAETLTIAEAKTHFLDRFQKMFALRPEQREELSAMDPEALAQTAIGGWLCSKDPATYYCFHTPPSPNLLFMRDPASVIGSAVSINKMATKARIAEPIFMETVMHFHPKFGVNTDTDILFDASLRFLEGHPEAHHSIEGGDILVLSPEILAIGISIRTKQSTVTMLAEQLRKKTPFKTLFCVLMPHKRSAMHLDTIFTQIDEERCLVFPPFLDPSHPEVLPSLRLDLTGEEIGLQLKPTFLKALAEEGLPLEPVFCGGQQRLDQEREQWTDGANAFCLAPGVILMYDRNIATAKALEKAGYNVQMAESILKHDYDLLDGRRYVVLIKGNELSRARGGPRCMTMPLKRIHSKGSGSRS
jgi:arginine deiminase